MNRFLIFLLFALVSPAAGQVQLQFPCTGCITPPTYTLIVRPHSSERLLVGFNPAVHPQLAVASMGPQPFPSQSLLLGGSGNDVPQDAAVDPSGNIWIVGNTDSDDFNLVNPIVSQKLAYRTAGFVIELDPTGSRILFSTYLGGRTPHGLANAWASHATAITFDSAGNAYIGGSTDEPDFPTTAGAYLSGKGGVDMDGSYFYSYLLKISPAGKLLYSTELETGTNTCMGGSACIGRRSTSASVSGLFVDSSGVATVAGIAGAVIGTNRGYVMRVAADGSSLLWNASDFDTYGVTTKLFVSADPVTGNADLFGVYAPIIFTPTNLPPALGTPGLFAVQLNANGSGTAYSIDFGQSSDSNASGMTVEPSGPVYLAGTSSAASVAPPEGTPNLGSDFILAIDSTGKRLRPPIHLPHGAVTAPPALDTTNGRQLLLLGAQNAFLTLPVNYNYDSPAIVAFANSASWALNTGFYPGTLMTLFGSDLPSTRDGVRVLINGLPAPILYASPTQINVVVPYRAPLNPPLVQVISSSGTIALQTWSSESIGIFTTDGVHAAALNLDGTVNSSDNPAPAGSIVSLFATGAVWPLASEDGAIATTATPLDQQRNKFEAFDWTDSPISILYAGSAPGLIEGVYQVNVQLPPNSPSLGYSPIVRLQSTTIKVIRSNAVRIYIK